jgi:hypothetical protein
LCEFLNLSLCLHIFKFLQPKFKYSPIFSSGLTELMFIPLTRRQNIMNECKIGLQVWGESGEWRFVTMTVFLSTLISFLYDYLQSRATSFKVFINFLGTLCFCCCCQCLFIFLMQLTFVVVVFSAKPRALHMLSKRCHWVPSAAYAGEM